MSTALSLIGYEKDLQPAMEFVFGSSFVCKDMNIAKKVTFDEKILKKSVTLDGNSFDPAGTLTGGKLLRNLYKCHRKNWCTCLRFPNCGAISYLYKKDDFVVYLNLSFLES